jgi:hypothetical protein
MIHLSRTYTWNREQVLRKMVTGQQTMMGTEVRSAKSRKKDKGKEEKKCDWTSRKNVTSVENI